MVRTDTCKRRCLSILLFWICTVRLILDFMELEAAVVIIFYNRVRDHDGDSRKLAHRR